MRQRELRAELAHKFDLQKRMQLHTVLCHANLLMKDIKESHAFHTHNPDWSEAPEVRRRLGELRREDLPHFSIVLCLR